MLEPRLAGIAHQEEHVDVSHESYLARPPFIIDENIPWMNITICKSEIGFLRGKIKAINYALIAFQNVVLDCATESAQDAMIGCHCEALCREVGDLLGLMIN